MQSASHRLQQELPSASSVTTQTEGCESRYGHAQDSKQRAVSACLPRMASAREGALGPSLSAAPAASDRSDSTSATSFIVNLPRSDAGYTAHTWSVDDANY
eukprot:5999956-Pleurochrysis_carterae.AAC.3